MSELFGRGGVKAESALVTGGREATETLAAKAREVEIAKPPFGSLDEFLEHSARYENPQGFIDNFVENLKGNVHLSQRPQYNPLFTEFKPGSAIVTPGQESINIGETALHRESELFKTIFHEEGHLRLAAKAQRGNQKALSRISSLDAEEEYVERVAVRYYERYVKKYGGFKY
jgi:hypothetical protein